MAGGQRRTPHSLDRRQQAETIRDALGELNEHARANLARRGFGHAAVGAEVRAIISSALDGRLAAAQAEQPLTRDWVSTWNKKAQELIKRLIEQPSRKRRPSAAAPATVRTATARRVVLLKKSAWIRATPMPSPSFLDAGPKKALVRAGRARASMSSSCARRTLSERAQLLLRRLLDQAGGATETGYLLVIDGEGLENLPGPDAHAEGRVRRASRLDRAGSAPPAVEGQGRAAHRCDA